MWFSGDSARLDRNSTRGPCKSRLAASTHAAHLHQRDIYCIGLRGRADTTITSCLYSFTRTEPVYLRDLVRNPHLEELWSLRIVTRNGHLHNSVRSQSRIQAGSSCIYTCSGTGNAARHQDENLSREGPVHRRRPKQVSRQGRVGHWWMGWRRARYSPGLSCFAVLQLASVRLVV